MRTLLCLVFLPSVALADIVDIPRPEPEPAPAPAPAPAPEPAPAQEEKSGGCATSPVVGGSLVLGALALLAIGRRDS